MKIFVAGALLLGALVAAPLDAAQAVTYTGDWRMTIHQEQPGVDCDDPADETVTGLPCQVSMQIRTNQPGWEGSSQYQVKVTLDGHEFFGDAGQTSFGTVDPDFAGVRAVASTATLSPGPHTLVLNWIYRGVWTCGPTVPNGCNWVGREHVQKVYRFRWHAGADQTIWPFVSPASTVSANAKRKGQKVIVKGVVLAQRLTDDFTVTADQAPLSGTSVALQQYKKKTARWITKRTVVSNGNGAVSAKVKSAKKAKWRWIVADTAAYVGSTSPIVKK